MPDIIAIVLAAGQGTRLGGPKALLLVAQGAREIPLIEAQCRDRLAAESTRALAVLRPDVAAQIGDRLRAAGAEVVVSHAPDAHGPAGSLAAAAGHLAQPEGPASAAPTFAAPRALVVTPVDVRVAPTTVAALLAALEGSSAPEGSSTQEAPSILAAVPRFAGRRGHPVALRPSLLARYLSPDPPPLRDHLRALAGGVLAVDVPDPYILEDLDHPHQLDLLARITGVPPAAAAPPRFFRGASP